MKGIFLAVCFLFLTACGGGGSSEPAPATPVTTTPTTPTVKLFEPEPLVIQDAETFYSSVCVEPHNYRPSIQFVIPVTLNDDEYTDFFVVYWCDLKSEYWGTTQTEATPNLVVAQVSDGAGGWYADNELVFNDSWPALAGASRKYTSGDFNNDGKVDFAFAMNWEDGRGADSVYDSSQSILISHDDHYEILNGGCPCWGHAVASRPNDKGFDDVLFAGYCNNYYFQAYTFLEEPEPKFTTVTDSYPMGVNMPASHWATDFQVVGTDGIVGTTCVEQDCGIGLFYESLDWQMTGSYLLQKEFDIEWYNWNNDFSSATVYNVNGELLVGVGASQMCVIGEETVVAMFDGQKHPTQEMDPNITYDMDEFDDHRFILVFDIVDGELVQREQPFVNEPNNYNANFFDCKDINGDGNTDIVISQFSRSKYDILLGGRPLVFLNDGNQFVNYEVATEVVLPGHSIVRENAQGYMYDVNSDGYQDVVVFGETTQHDGTIEIYTANKHLSLLDTPEDM